MARIAGFVRLLTAAAFLAVGTGVAVAQAPMKQRFCTSAGLNTAIQPVLYARSAGLFAKAGLDVTQIDLQDDSTAVQALIADSCDMLYAGAGTGIVAISRGADIRIVMSHTPWSDYLLVAQPEIKTVKDLAGKVMGTSKLGALNYQAATYALRAAGMEPSQVQFIATGGSDSSRAQALVAKTISAAVMNGTWSTNAMQNDLTLHVLYDVGAAFRDKFLSTAVFARGALIKARPEAVQAAVTALIEASRALQSDKAGAIEAAVKSGLPRKVVEPVYENIFRADQPYYGVNGGISLPKVESTVAILRESGDLDRTIPTSQILDMTFLDAALQKLGPYKP